MSRAELRVGDKVVCINTQSTSQIPSGLMLGNEYTVEYIHRCTQCMISVGVPLPTYVALCGCNSCGGIHGRIRVHFAWRFIKLDPDMKVTEEEYQLKQPISPAPQELQNLLEKYK